MSELTFNIADYRPLARERVYGRVPSGTARSGFIVLSSNSERLEREPVQARPAVVEIRSVYDAHRTLPRRGKILRFSNPASHRVYMMPERDDLTSTDDDPGPMVA